MVSLHLGKNDFTDKGIVALMKVSFPELKSLWLSTMCFILDGLQNLGDEGLIAISEDDPPKL